GFRYLNFENNTWIYTGSIGKYYKNFWFNFRTYLTPDNERISQSYIFTTRLYGAVADNYASISLGTGISPDDRSLVSQLNSSYKLRTLKTSVSYHASYKRMNIFSIGLSYANVEYLPKTTDDQIVASISYQRRF